MSSRLFPFCCAVLLASTAAAQDLEPRAFSQTPVGMNFALLSWGYTGGDLSFDQSVPIEDATGRIELATAGYVRSFGLLGKSAKLAAWCHSASATGRARSEASKRAPPAPASWIRRSSWRST